MLGATAGLTQETTSQVVKHYDAALQQIAQLKTENRCLKENLRRNEVEAMRLIGHYQQEIDELTNAITELKDDLRTRDTLERQQRQRSYNDKSTEIKDGDFNSREAELKEIICKLEDEIKSMTDGPCLQKIDFDRKMLHNQILAKQSFENYMDVLMRLATNAVSAEIADVISELLGINKQLSNEFRDVLDHLERLQMSRDELSKDLLRTRRELDFMACREKLLGKKLAAVQMKSSAGEKAKCTSDEANEDTISSNKEHLIEILY